MSLLTGEMELAEWVERLKAQASSALTAVLGEVEAMLMRSLGAIAPKVEVSGLCAALALCCCTALPIAMLPHPHPEAFLIRFERSRCSVYD